MKPTFKADWFMDGKEVELPTLKMDGEIAIAELQAENPIWTELSKVMSRYFNIEGDSAVINAYTSFLDSKEDNSEVLKETLRSFGITIKGDFKDEIEPKVQAIVGSLDVEDVKKKQAELNKELEDISEEVMQVQVKSQPMVLKKGLYEAFYRLKQLDDRIVIREKKVPLTLENLKKVITQTEIMNCFIKPFQTKDIAEFRRVMRGEEKNLETDQKPSKP